MAMPWTQSQICPTQQYGEHIVVRCRGCGARMSTKNIGWRNEDTNVVTPARSLFDIYGERCTCEDKQEHPLVHNCEVDDIDYDWKTGKFVPIKKTS